MRLKDHARSTNAHTTLPRLAALALSIVCLLALRAGVAQAESPKLISYGNFAGPPGASGIAVDQSTNDVFAAGLVNFAKGKPGQIDEFAASGKLLSPPSPFGESRYSGVAVNQTDGDVYVVDNVLEASEEGYETRIDTYDPSSGALLSSFLVPASHNAYAGNLTNVQIGSDSVGNVYLPVVADNEVLEYSPGGTLLQTFTGSGSGALSEPTGVAIDPSGDLWVADAKNNRIEELSPTDTPVDEIKSEGVRAVALDTHGNVFAIVSNSADFCGSVAPPCSHLVEYSSTGTQIADLGAGEFAPNEFFGMPSMLAVDDSNDRVYVTDSDNAADLFGENARVWVYGPPAAPAIGNELTAEVSTSEAKLGALVDPGGIDTTYRFEYSTTEAYGNTTPFPEGTVGEGVTSRTVWASANGLAPGTTYHYRVVASNELGTVYGPDQTFTTATSQAAACPNEQLRSGFSANLPDCRAYELVTPSNKVSAQPDEADIYGPGGVYGNLAASEGGRFAYISLEVLPGADSGGDEYLSTRGPDGWVPEDVLPRQSYSADRCTAPPSSNEATPSDEADTDTRVDAYSDDLSTAVLSDGGRERAGTHGPDELSGGCGAELVEVVSGEPMGYENLLLRNNQNGGYQLINVTPPGVTPADAHFHSASSDLSHICFSEHAQLTPDAPAGVENEYEWTNGVLRLIAVSEPALCQVSDYKPQQASGYKYFVSSTALTGGETNEYGEVAQNGHINLYLSHEGLTIYIATLGAGDLCVEEAEACTRVAPTGLFFAFTSAKDLTGYENDGVREIYLYSAASNKISCASCNPSGEAPTSTGAYIEGERPGGAPHYLASDGQLFFETTEGLVPSDTNGQEDVYEYENGQPHLISTGTGTKESKFLDASESGDDVFILTRQQLLPQATTEEALGIYDARVDGGFPESPSPPPCTTADACRAPVSPQPSIYGAPSSQTFSGAGNLAPPAESKPKAKPRSKATKCKKGYVKKKGKCVKRPKKKAKKSPHANKRTGK